MGENLVIYSLMVCMLCFGTLNTISGKAMDLIVYRGHAFNHPYFQTAGMFLGETLCLFFYLIYHRLSHSQQLKELSESQLFTKEGCIPKMGKLVFMISSFFDFLASSLMFLGLVLSAPSVYQMLRGFINVVVAIYTVVFLRFKLFRHQIVGIFLVFTGVSIVGLASILYQAQSAQNPYIGIIMILIAQFCAGGVFISEQLFFQHINLHPLQAVGIEGVSGFMYCALMLPILNLIPCENPYFCNGGYVENNIEAFKQMESWEISLLMLCFLLSIALFNFTGISITKKTGALARSTVDTSRTLLIWIISILLGWEVFNWVQLVGFIVMVIGTLMFNEILRISWFGMKESIVQRHIYMKNRIGSLFDEDKDDLLGFTPGAIYHYTYFKEVRTKRSIDLG